MHPDLRARLVPVILSGGSGTRLWPLSRDLYPKQLLALTGQHSLLQQAAMRSALAAPGHGLLIVCNAAHRRTVTEQLQVIGQPADRIMLEPVGRNTAPAIAVAAHTALARVGEDALLLVQPADQVITGVDTFVEAVGRAAAAAAEGQCVTFGVVPTQPETGFGYIHAPGQGVAARAVAAYVEKPARDRAEAFLANGDYYWNSGIFVFPARRFLELLMQHAPVMAECAARAHDQAKHDLEFTHLNAAAFTESPSNSVDYAVMEHLDDAVMVPLDAGWSDVGSWSALWALADQDHQGNVLLGDVTAIATQNSYLRSEHRLIAAIGLEDVVVVETGDSVLVAQRDQVQNVKQIVTRLKDEGRSEHATRLQPLPPQGDCEQPARAGHYEIRHILLSPDTSQPMQTPLHCAQHWVVIQGRARIRSGETTRMLAENEWVFSPIGEVHQIENAGKGELALVEIQIGACPAPDED